MRTTDMKKRGLPVALVSFAVLAIAVLGLPEVAFAGGTVSNMQCEGSTASNVLIYNHYPTFSAYFSSTYGYSTANFYQIQVGTSSGTNNMWDTSAVACNLPGYGQLPAVTYAGAALQLNTQYYWQIRFYYHDSNSGTDNWTNFGTGMFRTSSSWTNINPSVSGAHLEDSSGTQYSTAGGIPAGVVSLYSHYASIVESDPDYTEFYLEYVVAGSSYSDLQTNYYQTTNPGPQQHNAITVNGYSYVLTTVTHYDQAGASGSSTSAVYIVKPYTPQAPSAAQIPGNTTSLTVDLIPNTSEHSSVQHCFQCTTTGQYVQSSGALGPSPYWATDAVWGARTVTGLTSGTTYTFRTQSRSVYDGTVLSDWSATASAVTDSQSQPQNPTVLACEGFTGAGTPVIYDPLPEFSAVVGHQNSSMVATHAQFQTALDNSTWSGAVLVWDSQRYDIADTSVSARCPDIEYGTNDLASAALIESTTYYWRVKFFFGDTDFTGSEWSYSTLLAGGAFRAYKVYFKPSGSSGTFPYSTSATACPDASKLSEIIAAINGDNNSNPSGGGVSSFGLASENNSFIVYFETGTYSAQLYLNPAFAASPACNITLQNIAGHVPVFDPVGTDTNCVFIGANNTAVSGLQATGSTDALKAGFEISGSFITLGNCKAYGNSWGVHVAPFTDGVKIQNCEAYSNSFAGFYVHSSKNTEISSCRAFKNGTYGIALRPYHADVENAAILACKSFSNDAYGVWIQAAFDNVSAKGVAISQFNEIWNNGNASNPGYGIYLGNRSSSQSYPVIVSNALVYNTESGFQSFGLGIENSSIAGVRMLNNVFYGNLSAGINLVSGVSGNICTSNIIVVPQSASSAGIAAAQAGGFSTCDFNNIFPKASLGSVGAIGVLPCPTLGDWAAATGFDLHSISGDPLFAAGHPVLKASFIATGVGNCYLYMDLEEVSDYVIQSGDYLEYDVLWTGALDRVGFDYTTNSSQALRGSGAVDQNALGAHPATDISSRALNQWYHRIIALPAGHIGSAIAYFDVAGESESTATVVAFLDNILITDGAGTVRKNIYSGALQRRSIHLQNNSTLVAFDSFMDAHLKSVAGRWTGASWQNDSDTSPSIDSGDLSGNFANEPEPNGGRVNQGTYGNTAEASKSVVNPNKSDILYANDSWLSAQGGRVNPADLKDVTPNLSAMYEDDNLASVAFAAQVQVGTDTDWTAVERWNSPWMYFTIATPIPGERIPDITYNGSALSLDVTYYWRMRLRTSANCATEWSDAAYFVIRNANLPGKVANPSPASGATGVALEPALSWDSSNGATGYLVYFGTTASPFLAANSSGTSYSPGALSGNTTFYWRVDAYNADGVAEGDLWYFVTCNLPSKAVNPDPANGSEGISVDVILRWDSAPGCGYVVYLGLSPSTLENIGEVALNLYMPPRLINKTRYYWRVDTFTAAGATTGDLWTFKTETGVSPRKNGGGCSCSIPGAATPDWRDAAGCLFPALVLLLIFIALKKRAQQT
jgi:parallel beta-helix repeat protein